MKLWQLFMLMFAIYTGPALSHEGRLLMQILCLSLSLLFGILRA
jgi:hypothetical protein